MNITTQNKVRSAQETLVGRAVVARAALIDIASVLVFVAIGRRNHDEGTAISGVLSVAAPFLIALAVAWAGGRVWRAPQSFRIGVTVWASTVVVGLALRRLVFDHGIATPFVIVATLFLGFELLGWRAIATHRTSKRL